MLEGKEGADFHNETLRKSICRSFAFTLDFYRRVIIVTTLFYASEIHTNRFACFILGAGPIIITITISYRHAKNIIGAAEVVLENLHAIV